MKTVLISIHPKWVHKILDGKKTVEIRKTAPKISTPFKCYIYMTSGGWEWRDPFSTAVIPPSGVGDMYCGAKKVVAEFICDRIFPITVSNNGAIQDWTRYGLDKSCVPYDDMVMYIGCNRGGFGWHISKLKVYDKPKLLSDFRSYNCSVYWDNGYPIPTHEIKRPPQSWFYVEELKDNA